MLRVCVSSLLLLLGACSSDPTPDTFDPSGAYTGPATLVGEGAMAINLAQETSVTFADGGLTLAPDCVLRMTQDSFIGTDDSTGGSITTPHEIASLQSPVVGQMCTLSSARGAVTFSTTGGLVTIWRASSDGAMNAAIGGSMSDGTAVTYQFTGYK